MGLPHDLTVHGADGPGWYTFLLATGGEWRATRTTEDPDRLLQNDRRASGKVENGGHDSWKFGGIIIAANFDGTVKSVEINGKRYDPATVVEEWQRDAGVSKSSSSGGGGGDSSSGPSDEGKSSNKTAPWKQRQRDGPITTTRATYGIVNRPATTTDHRSLHVGHGKFGTGNGTEGEPFGTVQDALNERPTGVSHDYEIHLSEGTHGNEPGNSLNTGYGVVDAVRGASVKIIGDRENPRDHVIEAKQLNFQLLAPCLDVAIEGVHIKGAIQMNGHGAGLTLNDCVLTPGERWNKGGSVAIDFYGGSVLLLNSHIEGDCPAFNLTENGEVYFGGKSSVDVDAPLCSTGIGGGTIVPKGGTSIETNGKLTEGWEPAAVVIRDCHGVTDGLDTGPAALRVGR